MPLKLTIVDDHSLIIKAFESILHQVDDVQMIAQYQSAGALLEGLEHLLPDVLLLDMLLGEDHARDLVPLIRKKYPELRIIIVTSISNPATVSQMIKKGCQGYLLKDISPEELLLAIRTVGRDTTTYIQRSLEAEISRNMLQFKQSAQDKHTPLLTRRELEVLKLIAAECTTAEIAEHLHISFRTVETHRYSLLQKLSAKNAVGLTKAAILMGIAE